MTVPVTAPLTGCSCFRGRPRTDAFLAKHVSVGAPPPEWCDPSDDPDVPGVDEAAAADDALAESLRRCGSCERRPAGGEGGVPLVVAADDGVLGVLGVVGGSGSSKGSSSQSSDVTVSAVELSRSVTCSPSAYCLPSITLMGPGSGSPALTGRSVRSL